MTDRELLIFASLALNKISINSYDDTSKRIAMEVERILQINLEQPEKQWQSLTDGEEDGLRFRDAREYDVGYRDGAIWAAQALKERNS